MEEMRKILEAINMEVCGIMADWSDPRSECREILRLTAQALALSYPHPEAREEDKAKYPESDPVTGAPYFMDIEHPTRGLVPTYGGPFESYTLCERDMDESDKDTVRFIREVFDHDEGAWTDIIEPVHVVAITEARLDKLEEDSEALSRLASQKDEGQTLTVEQVGWLRMVLGRSLYRVEHFPEQSNDDDIEADELAKAIILLGGEPDGQDRTGETVVFDNNAIPYGQDMQFYTGVPAHIRFAVTRINDERYKLTAPGYGGETYGNGAIYVKASDLPAAPEPRPAEEPGSCSPPFADCCNGCDAFGGPACSNPATEVNNPETPDGSPRDCDTCRHWGGWSKNCGFCHNRSKWEGRSAPEPRPAEEPNDCSTCRWEQRAMLCCDCRDYAHWQPVPSPSEENPSPMTMAEIRIAMQDQCKETQALRSQLARKDEALKEIRTNWGGYMVTKESPWEKTLAAMWKEVQRMDGLARAALREPDWRKGE